MSSTFEIDFVEENVRARVPRGTKLDGNLTFSTGVLVEGDISGKITTSGLLVLLEPGKIEGDLEVKGDAYLLGSLSAKKAVIGGVLHIASSASVSGYIQAKDFQLHAGCEVSASLNRLPE